jgi:hypothetical protein
MADSVEKNSDDKIPTKIPAAVISSFKTLEAHTKSDTIFLLSDKCYVKRGSSISLYNIEIMDILKDPIEAICFVDGGLCMWNVPDSSRAGSTDTELEDYSRDGPRPYVDESHICPDCRNDKNSTITPFTDTIKYVTKCNLLASSTIALAWLGYSILSLYYVNTRYILFES